MFMNKLLLKPQIYIEKDGTYQLEGDRSKVEIFILPNVCCDLLFFPCDEKQEVEVHVSENAKFRYQSFLKDVCSNIQIYLDGYGAEVEFIYSMIATDSCGLDVHVFHLAPHTSSVFYNSIVNYGSSLATIQVDASVPKGMVGCHLTQDNKILLIRDGKGKILPNLWIDEFDSFAEHAAYISKFSKDELFYLQMRGISLKDAYFLLTKSLLLGKLNLEEEFLAQFTEMIQNMGR